jgi:hypothetical protein
VTFIDALVRGYRLTGDVSFLDRAKLHWNRGSKGVPNDVSTRKAGDNEVGRFTNNSFLDKFWYSYNRGDLSYTHLLFYDVARSIPGPTPPAAPSGLTVR